MIKVLVADDDRTNLHLLKILVRGREDILLEVAHNGQEALDLIQRGMVDILITDLRMPLVSGDELLTTVKRKYPHIPVIIMTGFGSIEGAVDYLHRGADDYLTKPLTKEVFLHRLDRVKERVVLMKELQQLRSGRASSPIDELLGRSPKMVDLKNQLPTLALTDASVVIYGESGTGKEIVARTLHALSKRSARPFVTVNCGALPETLLESELFGHRRGAFTDAHADAPGLVDAANTGTLFLDEIGEISLGVQVKLLRFLELKEYRPVGSPKSKIADVRIVAATNRDLKKAVEAKSFREDLYYRLNVVPVTLPPLRDRPGDIPLLAATFLERFNRQAGKNVVFGWELYRELERHSWPGNIRELENKVEQIVAMAQSGEVHAQDVMLPVQSDAQGRATPLGSYKEEKEEVLRRFERGYLEALLKAESGHLSNAAKRAGLDRKNLWQLLRKHDLKAGSFKN